MVSDLISGGNELLEQKPRRHTLMVFAGHRSGSMWPWLLLLTRLRPPILSHES